MFLLLWNVPVWIIVVGIGCYNKSGFWLLFSYNFLQAVWFLKNMRGFGVNDFFQSLYHVIIKGSNRWNWKWKIHILIMGITHSFHIWIQILINAFCGNCRWCIEVDEKSLKYAFTVFGRQNSIKSVIVVPHNYCKCILIRYPLSTYCYNITQYTMKHTHTNKIILKLVIFDMK